MQDDHRFDIDGMVILLWQEQRPCPMRRPD